MTGTRIGDAEVGGEAPAYDGRKRLFIRCGCGNLSSRQPCQIRKLIAAGRYQCIECYSARPAWTWADLNRRRAKT